MATPRGADTNDGRGFGAGASGEQAGTERTGGRRYQAPFRPDGSLHEEQRAHRHPGGGEGRGFRREPAGRYREPMYESQGPDLKALIRSLGEDASQLAHDEMTLAKIELRSIADTLTDDLQDASKALVMDLAKVGFALSLATLAGLALTAGAIMAVGALLGGAYWAGGLIVGAVLLIAAGLFGASAAKDLRDRESLRLESTRARAEQNKDVLAHEARETGEFARDEVDAVKRGTARR